MEQVEKLLNLCVKARMYYGVDCFFEYMPHVDAIMVQIHKDGWKVNEKVDKEFIIYTRNDTELDCATGTAKQLRTITECEEYIKLCCKYSKLENIRY